MKSQPPASYSWSRANLAILLTVLLSCGAGCEVAVPEHKVSPGQEAPPEINVTQNQVRLRMRSLVDPMCGRIAQSADEIMEGANDRAVQLAALRWKIDAVPALRKALFEPDPYTAALDTLVLCVQMTDYFETGPGKGTLGPGTERAIAACRDLREEFTQVLASATTAGDASTILDAARKWATAHPIQHSIADRESTLTRVFEREIGEARSAGQAIATVTTTLDDLNRKLEVYSDQLFRQTRWEIERLRLELRADEFVPLVEQSARSAGLAMTSADQAAKAADRAAVALERVALATERTGLAAEQAPAIVAKEHAAAASALKEELNRAMQFIREERIAMLAQLGQERGAAMAELRETITEQRHQVEGTAQQITAKNIDYAIQRITWLVVVSLAAVALLGLIGLFLARWMLFPRPA